MRRAVKWLGLLAATLALAALGLFGLNQYRNWTADRLIAEARAFNQSEWETGVAARATYELELEIDGTTERREKRVICYRKQEFDFERGIPVLRMVYEPVGFLPGFGVYRDNRSFGVGPDEGLCARAFEPGISAALPAVLDAEIGINSLLDDRQRDSDGRERGLLAGLKPRPRCRVSWTGDRPITFGQSLTFRSARLTAVEIVPLRDAIDSPRLMGPVESYLSDVFIRIELPPSVWNTGQSCWMRPGDSRCDSESDWDCGAVRF